MEFVAASLVAGAVGCGGGSGGGGGPPPPPPNVLWQCLGTVSDGMGNTLILPVAPGSSAPALDVCAPNNVAADTAVAQCATKCQMNLQAYADAINAGSPSPMVMANQLTCNIVDIQQKASTCPASSSSPLVAPPPENGGPAQYTASLSGNMHMAVNVDVVLGSITATADSGISGQMGYTIIPLDRNCGEGACELLVTALGFSVNNFRLTADIAGVTVIDHLITGMKIDGLNWVSGSWFPNGHFEIPAGTTMAVTATDNGTLTGFNRTNNNPITGTIDPVAGTVTFDTFSQTESDTTTTISGLSGPNTSSPPTAVITLPATVECNQTNGADVTLDSRASSTPTGTLPFASWQVNGGPVLNGATVPARLNLGPNDILLNVRNSTLAVGVARQTTTVVDTTRPTFAPLPGVTNTLCDPNSQASTIPTPGATDICSPTVTVTGTVITSNGRTLNPPLPIVNGRVSLPAGVHVVQWRAVDQSGNVATTTQTLTVRPAIEASDAIAIEDRALTRVQGGGFAMLGNTGQGLVSVGVQAQTGSILTQGNVFLRDRSIVNGNVLAAGTITTQNLVTVTGTATQRTTVALPPGRDLAGVVFPPTNAGNVTLAPDTTRTLAPGAYAAVTVFSRATLTLTAGTYFFNSLDLEPQSRLNLNQAGGAIRIFVRNSVIHRGQIANVGGTAASFVLGYAGTSALFVQTPFQAGTIIAPNASVVITSLGAGAFAGQLSAKSIQVQPDATLTCAPVTGATP